MIFKLIDTHWVSGLWDNSWTCNTPNKYLDDNPEHPLTDWGNSHTTKNCRADFEEEPNKCYEELQQTFRDVNSRRWFPSWISKSLIIGKRLGLSPFWPLRNPLIPKKWFRPKIFSGYKAILKRELLKTDQKFTLGLKIRSSSSSGSSLSFLVIGYFTGWRIIILEYIDNRAMISLIIRLDFSCILIPRRYQLYSLQRAEYCRSDFSCVSEASWAEISVLPVVSSSSVDPLCVAL